MNKKTRFVITLSVLLVSGFLATSLVSYFVAHDSLSDQMAHNTLPLTSDNIYSEIQQDLLQPIFISSLMAQDTFLRDWALSGEKTPDAIVRYLKEIQEQFGAITSFFVSEKTRKYYHSSGVLKTVRRDDPADAWYFRVHGMKDPYEINIDADTANPASMTIFINYRVMDYVGRFIGTTGVGLQVERVKKLVNTYQERYGRTVYFIDRKGEITLHGSSFTMEGNIRRQPGLDRIATRILTTPSSSHEIRRNGRTVYLNSRLVPEFQWYLLVEQEEDPAQALVFNTLLLNLLICAGITALVLWLANLTIGGYQRRLEYMATTDKLTGLANRHGLEILSETMLKSTHRRREPLSVVLFDIDKFKQVNDRYGHPTGDAVINAVAQAARKSLRDSDVIGRWGGEEYLALLPGCDQSQAVSLAEKIRQSVAASTHGEPQGPFTVTVSLGIAQLQDDEGLEQIVQRADQALYEAKEGGRNQVRQSAPV